MAGEKVLEELKRVGALESSVQQGKVSDEDPTDSSDENGVAQLSIIKSLQCTIDRQAKQLDRQSDQIDSQAAQIKALTEEVRKLSTLLTKQHTERNDADRALDTGNQHTHSTANPTNPTPLQQPSPAAKNKNTGEEPKKQILWSEVVQKGCITDLPQENQDKINEAVKALKEEGFAPRKHQPRKNQNADQADNPQDKGTSKPIPEAVYFGDMPRGPIGKIRRTLCKALPKWSILNISFIGGSVTEILCHKPLVPRLIATLKLMRYSHLKTYDPTSSNGRGDKDPLTIKYRAACYHRWSNAAKNTYSEVSKAWYTSHAEGLLSLYPDISDATPFPPRNKTSIEVTPPAGDRQENANNPQANRPSRNGEENSVSSSSGDKKTERDADAEEDPTQYDSAQEGERSEHSEHGHPQGDQQ